MATPDTLTPEQLDRATPALLKLLLQTGDRGYQDSIDAFDPLPTAANNWLRGSDGAFAGVFLDNQPDGTAKRVKFRIAKGDDGWESETELETSTIDQSETHDYRAIIDSIISYQGVSIGVQHTPGSVRFPRAAYAKKLRCGYGHLRGHYQAGRSLKGFIHPSLLSGESGGNLWLLLQDDGETAQTKFMAGWDDKEGAIAAYAQEMPAEWLKDIWEATPKQLGEFRRSEVTKMTEDATETKLDGGGEFAGLDLEPLDFATGQAKKKPSCKKGFSCGYSCQKSGNKCRNPLEGQYATYAEWAAGQIKAKSAAPQPVSAALTFKGGSAGKRQQMEDAIAAIDAVHTDGTLPAIPVKIKPQPEGTGGAYLWDDGTPQNPQNRADSIEMSNKIGDELDFAHEVGHFLDNQALHTSGEKRGYASDIDTDLNEWRIAVARSRNYTALLNDRSKPTAQVYSKKQQKLVEAPTDKAYLDYLTAPHELFARSYAQWVATKSGNPAMLEALAGYQGKRDRTPIHQAQWDDDDFEPIGKALDGVFRRKGWLK